MSEDHILGAATIIESFLDGSCGAYDWDDFISIRSKDPQIQAVKDYCSDSSFLYPPNEEGHWCSDIGAKKLARLSRLIRAGDKLGIQTFLNEERKGEE